MSHSWLGQGGMPAKRPQALHWARAARIWGGLANLVLSGLLVLIRDLLKYLEWTEVVYQRFWPQRMLLASHALTASICLVIAPFQFCSRLVSRSILASKRTSET